MENKKANWPSSLMAMMMAVVPIIGVPHELWMPDTVKSILVAMITLGAGLAFFLELRRAGGKVYLHAAIGLALLLAIYALGSMIWSDTYLASVEAVRWLLIGLIIFLGANSLNHSGVTILTWGIHAGAVWAALWAALQFWFDFALFPQFAAPASTFANRNFLAEFLVCTLPFSVFLVSQARRKVICYLLVLSIGFNTSVLLMTGTRSALLGLLLLVILIPGIVWWRRRHFYVTSFSLVHRVSLVVLLVASVGSFGSINTTNAKLIAEFGPGDAIDRTLRRAMTVGSADEYSRGTFSMRLQLWKATGRMMEANPMTGVGAGAWEMHVPLYQEANTQTELDHFAHNEILQVLAEYGLFGWLFWIGLLGYLAWASYKTLVDQSISGQQEALLRALTLVSLALMLLVGIAGFPLRLATTSALFAVGLSILAASDLRLNSMEKVVGHSILLPRWSINPLLALLILCSALAVYISVQAIRVEEKFMRAYALTQIVSGSGRYNDPSFHRIKQEIDRLLVDGLVINRHYGRVTSRIAAEFLFWEDWGRSLRLLATIHASRPNVVVITANIARAYLELSDLEKAQEYLSKAVDQQPQAPVVKLMQAKMAVSRAQFSEASQLIVNILMKDGVSNDLLNIAYLLGERSQQWDLVVKVLRQRIRTLPSEASHSWLILGGIYSRPEVDDKAQALQSYRYALTLTPGYLRPSVKASIPAEYQRQL